MTMERTQRPRSGMALGGIGAGWFEIRHDGCTANWNVMNNEPLWFGPLFEGDPNQMLFFIVRYQVEGEDPKMKLLQIEPSHGAAGLERHEIQYIFPWMTGIERIESRASFPFTMLTFHDSEMPFVVEMETFSPFIPFDVKNSSLPAAIFRFRIRSTTDKRVDVMLMSSMRSAVAYDRPERTYTSQIVQAESHKTVCMGCDDVPADHSSVGTMGLTSLAGDTTHYAGWEHPHPYYEIVIRNKQLPNIDDTDGRNSPSIEDRIKHGNKERMRCFSTLAVSRTLAGVDDEIDHTLAATWHFPNNYASDVLGEKVNGERVSGERIEGHYYENFFDDAADVGAYIAENLDDLTDRTRAFHNAYFDSTAPAYVLDQVNSHLNTFLASSWLTKEGHFGIVEGLSPNRSYAGLSTTDVAMYGSQSYAALFPSLARQVMSDYAGFQAESGKIAHSISRNFKTIDPHEIDSPRLDMPAQFAFMALREFFWSRDRDYLEVIWPPVKKALDYVLRERDMNGDGLPDMEGAMCSYDNFPMYGVASYVAGQFLAAVQSAIQAATILGDEEAVATYSDVFAKGLAAFENKAWNGEYYRLYNDLDGPKGDTDEGCLADQVIGQWAAHQVGLAPLFDHERVVQALQHVMKANYRDDQGVRNCQWPGDAFLHDVTESTWVDQANTCWTGVELALAGLLIYEGLTAEGLAVVKNVDDRYRRNGMYWDHQEFGGHYFRPMSAWTILNALLGYSARDGVYTFAPRLPEADQRLLFTAENAYGHFTRTADAVTIEMAQGTLPADTITIELANETTAVEATLNGQPIDATADGKTVTVRPTAPLKALTVSVCN